jgi:UDP-N-acetylmuramate--alanine ligase
MKKQPQHSNTRVVITGGGTGGHIFPAIAIGNALAPEIGAGNILFIGARGKMEMEKVPAAGYRIEGLPITGLQGKLTINNLMLPIRLISSFIQANRILRRFRPDVVVGVGGFASFPALWMARLRGIRVVIQEQNSVPGKVNRIAGRWAERVCTAFPGLERYFPAGKIIMTGNPVRKSISGSRNLKNEGCTHYGFDPMRPVVMVVGGSQGARSLNKVMMQILEGWVAEGIQVLWQTGTPFYPEARELTEGKRFQGVVVTPFIDTMELAYGAATLVVSRAGALAIAEIALAALPSILVPFPFAAADHQTSNAMALANDGAAIMMPDNELEQQLDKTVRALVKDQAALSLMSGKVQSLAFPEADKQIAGIILDLAAHERSDKGIPGMENIKLVYFLGAGGIGMSGLARWFLMNGKEVHGYDRTPTPLTRELENEGVVLHYSDDPSRIPGHTDLVVITPAIPKNQGERLEVERRGFPSMKRAEVLGLISRTLPTIAVAGTHGKTSTSALITHLFKSAGIPVTAFIGGITKNYRSNFLCDPESRFLVVEADEFDRSFLHLAPQFSVITSTDADHLDIYGTHEQMQEAFISFGNLNGQTGPLAVSSQVILDFGKPVTRYSITDITAVNRAENIRDEGEKAVFDLIIGEIRLTEVTLGIPGRHNIENAVAASAAALWGGVSPEALLLGLATYQGVKRRFDIRINREGLVYIDDYAHHPRELTACIQAVKKIYPSQRVTGIFQPHLFTRTRDFAEEFAASLELLDRIILLEIYPAREEPIPGITSSMLMNLINHPDKVLLAKQEVIPYLQTNRPEILLTLGAGDIDTLVPEIESAFNQEEGER